MQIKNDCEKILPEIQTASKTLIEKLQKSINLTQELNTIGDDAQLKKLDLQDKLRKMQEMMQLVSNMLKNDHDTLKAILQNLKA